MFDDHEYSMDNTIKNNISKATNAKKFLVNIRNKFKRFDKTEKSNYLNLLTNTKYYV